MTSPLRLESVLQSALEGGADFAELFLEETDEGCVRMENGDVEGVDTMRVKGAGLQLLCGRSSVYVHTNENTPDALERLARTASELMRGIAGGDSARILPLRGQPPDREIRRPSAADFADRIAVLKTMDRAARDTGVGIRRLAAACFGVRQHVTVANSEGLYTGEVREYSRARLQMTVEEGGRALGNWEDVAAPEPFSAFRDRDFAGFAKDALIRTRNMLTARKAPSCVIPVVLEAEGCGTLWHESCGHSLEAGAVAAGTSEFAGKMGQKVASDRVTLIDDGTIPGLYGTTGIDDEGHPRGRNILIERGILKGYLCSRFQGRLIGLPQNGCGRRQNYTYAPVSRMGNTFLDAGEDDDDEMISSLAEGLFVTKIGGGTGGAQFSLEVKEGFWIRNGEICDQVRGLMLTGNGLDVIRKIDRVGKHLVHERSGSFCGAASGLVPVTASQPRVRISEMAVSGG